MSLKLNGDGVVSALPAGALLLESDDEDEGTELELLLLLSELLLEPEESDEEPEPSPKDELDEELELLPVPPDPDPPPQAIKDKVRQANPTHFANGKRKRCVTIVLHPDNYLAENTPR